jgi:hypothetical protein
VSVGTLYYNLDLMGGLVTQDESKRYFLTPSGKIAHSLLIGSEEKLVSLGIEDERRAGWFRLLSKIFTMRSLFSYLYASLGFSLPSAMIILVYGVWITCQARLLPIMGLYSDRPVLPPLWTAGLFLTGLLAINVLGNLFSFIFYRRLNDGADYLLVGSCYAILPSLVFPTIWVVCRTFLIPLSLIIAQIIMLLTMGFSLCLLTTAISMAKGLRMEQAALVTMIVFYLAVGLAFVFYPL